MNYMSITKQDIANGYGTRVVLWVAGCNHHCKGCQNPESWDKNAGKLFDTNTVTKLMTELSEPYIDGLTLSGGDPLFPSNRTTVEAITNSFKKNFHNKDIWMWTGYKWDEVKNLPLMKNIDVLVDGEFIEKQRDITLAFRGSPNQRIIDVQKSLAKNKVVLWEENNV